MFGEPGPLSFDKILNRISTKAPELFGMMYHAGAMYSATGVTSPVYLANIRHARQLREFILARGYDAVVCSHLFPMETLTFLRRHEDLPVRCYGVLSDYTCIPFLAETELDGYFLPHTDVRADCVSAGMPGGKADRQRYARRRKVHRANDQAGRAGSCLGCRRTSGSTSS